MHLIFLFLLSFTVGPLAPLCRQEMDVDKNTSAEVWFVLPRVGNKCWCSPQCSFTTPSISLHVAACQNWSWGGQTAEDLGMHKVGVSGLAGALVCGDL